MVLFVIAVCYDLCTTFRTVLILIFITIFPASFAVKLRCPICWASAQLHVALFSTNDSRKSL